MLENVASSSEPVGEVATPAAPPSLAPRLLVGVLGLAVLAMLWLVVQVVAMSYVSPARIDTTLPSSDSPLRPGTPIAVSIQGWQTGLTSVRLMRTEAGNPGAGETPVTLQPLPSSVSTWQLAAPDGGQVLRPDGMYRLVVQTVSPAPGFPLPGQNVVDQEYRFTTVSAPRIVSNPEVAHPGWGESVQTDWSLPLTSVAATVDPSVPVIVSVDQQDPRRTHIQLGDANGQGLADGQTYTVTFTKAQTQDGLDLQQPATVRIAIPARPHFTDAPTSPALMKYGDTFTLTSSVPLKDAQVEGADHTSVAVDGTHVRITMPDYLQNDLMHVRVVSATSTEGAPLAQPLEFQIKTTDALDAPAITPGDGEMAVPLTAHPTVSFSKPVADRIAAEKALEVTPALPGKWQWTSSQRVEFLPASNLPYLSTFHVLLHGGPYGPRSVEGGYIEQDQDSVFRTVDYKRIDVNLTTQTLQMIENGRVVNTIATATGVAAAPTPTGTFYVQYKEAQMRFTGFNPDGSHYDIPDVHWVMPFWGDYTIHGAYWRGRFGTPGSDGCVSMTDADAKTVYDWASVGTPITIHT